MSQERKLVTLNSVNPLRRRIIEDICDAIVEEYPFDEDKTTLMDYACGKCLQSYL